MTTDGRWRLGVDIRGWEARGRGIDLYVTNVLERWSRDPNLRLTLLAPRAGEVPPLDVAVRRISLRRALLASVGIGSYASIERDQDAIFLPNLTVYPRTGQRPMVVTVHDATPLLHQRFFTVRDRISHRLVNIVAQLKAARRLLANSEQTRRELLQVGMDPHRIRVIYHGIGDRYAPSAVAKIEATLAKYGVGGRPYVLYLGAVERRKNVGALIRGFRLARARGLDARLVIAGPVREPEELEGRSEDVSVLGWIDDEDKAPLYSGALAAVSLARHEGFGMLPLESFACGTRPILARLPVYEETIAERAIYLDELGPESVAEALLKAEQSPESIAETDIERLRAKFSWDRCAAETLEEIVAVSDGA